MAKCSQLIQLPSLISSEFSKVKGEVGFGVVVVLRSLDDSGRYFVESWLFLNSKLLNDQVLQTWAYA